jgi:integrase
LADDLFEGIESASDPVGSRREIESDPSKKINCRLSELGGATESKIKNAFKQMTNVRHSVTKVKANYRITIRKFSEGERYAVLLTDDGSPVWHPTLFITTQYRNNSKPSSTMRNALSAIRMVLMWANENEIDLQRRFQQERYLDPNEIRSLASYLKKKAGVARAESNPTRQGVVVPIELVRARSPKGQQGVAVIEQGHRLNYARIYLVWLANACLLPKSMPVSTRGALIAAMAKALRLETPGQPRASRVATSKIITPDQASRIEEATSIEGLVFDAKRVDHCANRARRDRLIVELYKLGIRGGELRALKISDFDLWEKRVTIARRHNDSADPRPNQPVAKTFDRTLPISTDLRDLIENFIINVRRQYRTSRKHEFLIFRMDTARKAGTPLSASGLARVLNGILEKAGVAGISGHSWRHTVATERAKQLYASDTPENRVLQMLAYEFGWADGSPSLRHYTHSLIVEQAYHAARFLQNKRKRDTDR